MPPKSEKCVQARLTIAATLALWACSTPERPGKPSPPTRSEDSATATHRPDLVDSADSGDPGPDPVDPTLYCRSLDPDWAVAYTDPLDQQLAEIIDDRGLLGDPTLYVDTDGLCRQRALPTIDHPLAQLGRQLFFSVDLSGDRDVACATCHHPELAGADALVLPVGVGHDPSTVGEDRARGISDIARVRAPRNTPTILNVALWDHRLMWDGRVEALDPEAGFNGESGGISIPSGPSDAPDLVAAQALLPIGHPDEMAGSLTDSSANPTDTIVDRLAETTHWQAAFEATCTHPDTLPDSWRTACTSDAPLITAAHLAQAIATYERSLVFVDTPWSAYVQGNVDALTDAAKQGALAFYRSPADGGLNCGACHTGDFFTDEQLHAVGSPQIGPGDPFGTGTPGIDRGRAELTDHPDDAFAFRTPTLLNVTHTPPYFHAGSIPSLFRSVVHYRGVADSIAQTFGHNDEPLRHPPHWCTTALFADISDCDDLYRSDATHDGDLSGRLDGELEGIDQTIDLSAVLVVLFLEALTDPRVDDPDHLAPWIEGGTVTPTATSNPWPDTCHQMLEWPRGQDLRVKGARWLFKQALLPDTTVNTGLRPTSVFGLEYWEVQSAIYTHHSNLTRQFRSVAAGVLAQVSAAERAALYAAWKADPDPDARRSWDQARVAVEVELATWRDTDQPVDSHRLSALLDAVHTEETAFTTRRATAYGSVWATQPEADRPARRDQLRRYLSGDTSNVPIELIDDDVIMLSSTIRDELDTAGITYDPGFAAFVLGWATWTAGPDCVGAFDNRQDNGSRAAAYFGFGPWVDDWFFNLQTGIQEPVSAQEELSGLIAHLEATAGSGVLTTTLPTLAAAQRAWITAQADTAAATRHLGEAVAAGADPAPFESALAVAGASLASAETDVLVAELTYYFHLRDTLSDSQKADVVHWIDCLESPATQAMAGAGGFDAAGGGSCLP